MQTGREKVDVEGDEVGRVEPENRQVAQQVDGVKRIGARFVDESSVRLADDVVAVAGLLGRNNVDRDIQIRAVLVRLQEVIYYKYLTLGTPYRQRNGTVPSRRKQIEHRKTIRSTHQRTPTAVRCMDYGSQTSTTPSIHYNITIPA